MSENTTRLNIRSENERRLRGAARIAHEAIASDDFATRKAGRLVLILVRGALRGDSKMLTLEVGEVRKHLRFLGFDDAYSLAARGVFRKAAEVLAGM